MQMRKVDLTGLHGARGVVAEHAARLGALMLGHLGQVLLHASQL